MATHRDPFAPPSPHTKPINEPLVQTHQQQQQVQQQSPNDQQSPNEQQPQHRHLHHALDSHQARRTSQPATSPLRPTNSPRQVPLRRPSSAMSITAQRPSSSPKLSRKSSRTSLGGAAGVTVPEDLERRPTPKRSISNLIANLREAQSTMESIEEPVPLTAPQIAADHFTREILNHDRPDVDTETAVIIHDACYGHRYSRLKTTKATLSMIVERPERIHASVLGAAAAYVRLGGHHAGGLNAPHPDMRPWASPPFKIRRTTRSIDITSSCVTNVHGTAWMAELQSMCQSAGDKLAAGVKELSRSNARAESEGRKLHEGDLYLAAESLNAFRGALGGVADAVDTVFHPASQTKRAFVAIRPPGHHCSADYPSGFCWLNNVHVGIEYAAQTCGLTHAAILDFDLHHGDGSQAITWERNSKNYSKRLNAKSNSKIKLGPDIAYYSLHDINSYPCEMGDDEKVQAASLCIENAHGQNVWNVHLQPWKTEAEFWELYETRYRILLDKARTFLCLQTARLKAEGKSPANAAIFISAGFDASEWEGEGMQRHKVNVPTEFYARFTRDVVQLAQEPGTGCGGRVISVLEGGYSDRALCSGVLSHLSGLCASPLDMPKQESAHGLDEMMRGLQINGSTTASAPDYDKKWWSDANLTALEHKINPPPPPQGGKARANRQPTYATPTESFAYKVIDPDKFARSVSGTMKDGVPHARPLTPPPPEVDWVVATQELSKLMIPQDRQTRSCTAEELGGVRVKKERQSIVPEPTIATDGGKGGRQLRDRTSKAKTPAAQYVASTHSDDLDSMRSISRTSNRRQTMHELPSASDPAPAEQMQTARARRRSSVASAISVTTADTGFQTPPVPIIPNITAAANGTMKAPPVPSAAAIQAKKTRAPLKPKKIAPPASAPLTSASSSMRSASETRAVPSADRAVNGLAKDRSQVADRSTSESVRTGAKPGTAPGLAQGGDLDALTSSMKRVTLKVGSREEHDRKQKEREAAERKARAVKAAETRRINAAAKKTAKDYVVPAGGHVHGAVANATMAEIPTQDHALNRVAFERPIIGPGEAMTVDPWDVAREEPMLPRYSLGSVPLDAATTPPAPAGYPSTYATMPPANLQPPLDSAAPPFATHMPAPASFATMPALSPTTSTPHHTANHSLHGENPVVYSLPTLVPQSQLLPQPAQPSPAPLPSHFEPATAERRALPVFSSTGTIPFGATPPGWRPSAQTEISTTMPSAVSDGARPEADTQGERRHEPLLGPAADESAAGSSWQVPEPSPGPHDQS